jgi:hypothetical protein
LIARTCAQGFRACLNTGPDNFARRLYSTVASSGALTIAREPPETAATDLVLRAWPATNLVRRFENQTRRFKQRGCWTVASGESNNQSILDSRGESSAERGQQVEAFLKEPERLETHARQDDVLGPPFETTSMLDLRICERWLTTICPAAHEVEP